MRTMRKIATVALACIMMASTASAPVSAAKKVTVKKVTVSSSISGNKSTVYVAKGKKASLKTTVTVTPNKSANKGVTYTSKNKKIATVSSQGVITGKKAGTTKITVTSAKNTAKKATITVKVMGAAVSKVKMNKKKATIKIGDALTLKATVTAGSKACKKVAWKTSKKKVATVTKSGVVKGVSAGTATITAQAIDGSGKKATCKVTVSNAVNMKTMDVLNGQSVTFTLDKAQTLTADQVAVKNKVHASGEYKNALKVESITTADNMTYNVVLSGDTKIAANDYVQVSVPTLSGDVKALEKQYLEQVCAFVEDEVSTWQVGSYKEANFSFGDGEGYSEFVVTGLPAGLTSEVKGNHVVVKGTPTTPGTVTAVLKATDELGNTLSKNLIFAIGSDTVIAGAAAPVYNLVCEKDATLAATGYAIGGSGSYTYEIVSDAQNSGAKLTKNEGTSFVLSASITTPGDYTVKVRAKDKKDANKVCDIDVVLHIAQGITVGGCLKDAQGTAMLDGQITFINKNRADRYFTSKTFSVNNENGTYSAIISAGTYDIQASRSVEAEAGCATNCLYSQNLAAAKTGLDISLPLYKVTFTSTDANVTEDIKKQSWNIAGDQVGTGNTVYVKAGNYQFASDVVTVGEDKKTEEYTWFAGGSATEQKAGEYTYTGSANVVNAAVSAAVSKVTIKDAATTETAKYLGAKDTTYEVKELDQQYDLADVVVEKEGYANKAIFAYAYTPKTTGDYKVDNEKVNFYDEDGNKVKANKDGSYALAKDMKYIVGLGNYADKNDNTKFKISKLEETTTEAAASTTGAASDTTEAAASTTQTAK